MQVVLKLDENDKRTLQQQVFQQIRGLILDGRLRSGDPVPASRELSQQLSVSRNTIVIAYDQLLSEGYLESRAGVGTFVSSVLPETAMRAVVEPARPALDLVKTSHVAMTMPDGPHAVISPHRGKLPVDFWVGRSEAKAFPVREWRRIMDTKLRYSGRRLAEYHDPQGQHDLRQALADYLGPARGVAAEPADIVCTGGSQDGLALIAQGFAGAYKTLVHEDPCYHGVRALFANQGYDTIGVPVDGEGLDVDQMPDIRRALVYVTPSHQFPTGVTLSLERRFRLLEWAVETDSIIIEDDYNGDFRYEGAPLTALRGLDQMGRVIYLGTFSKSFGPALRLGYMVSTAPMATGFAAWKGVLSNGLPWLEQATMAEFITSGGFRRHLRRIRGVYMARRNALLDALDQHFPDSARHGRRGGMHMSLRLPGVDLTRVQERLAAQGIAIYRVADCGAYRARKDGFEDMLVLGYAAVGEKDIARAVRVLAEAVG